MDASERLARNLVSESKAYGYTLTIWGAGALLFHHYGTPNVAEIGLYIGGALVAMATLTAVAFGGFLAEHGAGDGQLVAASMVHLLATGGNLVVSYALVAASARVGLPANAAFVLVGFQTTVCYNGFLLLEHALTQVPK